MPRLLAALCVLCFSALAAQAQDRAIHYGLLVTNDALGDGKDRWRTGSFASSLAYAPGWSGTLPGGPSQLWELRINGEIITPENSVTPAPGDRVYAQALTFGLHTRFQPGAFDYALGGELVVTGPAAQMDHLQDLFHDIFGGDGASPAVKAAQISDDLDVALVVEAGREFRLGGTARLRPFVEARAGVETLVRAGADLTLGRFGQGGLLARAPVSGLRYSVIQEEAPYQGLSLMLGADVAHVADSEFIPSSGAARLRDTRARARAGLHWRNRAGNSLFYGLTWLEEEFASQSEPQVVGSLQLRVKF